MTGSALTTARQRPSTPLRRALGHEWRRCRHLLALYGVLITVTPQCATHLDLRLGFVLILPAVRPPAARADPVLEHGRRLRRALARSRADTVRARTRLVGGGQRPRVLGTAGVILLSHWPPGTRHWSTLQVATSLHPGPASPTLGDHL